MKKYVKSLLEAKEENKFAVLKPEQTSMIRGGNSQAATGDEDEDDGGSMD